MIAERPDWVLSPPARLGRADRRVLQRSRPDTKSSSDETVNHRIGQAFEEEGADAWFKPGAKERFLGDAVPDPDELDQDRRHPRRLVRERHHPCLGAAQQAEMAGPRVPGRHVSRRLRPASRLVPFLAARELRAPTASRPIRVGADPRLHPRRRGQEDVEVAGQHRRPAGHHQAVRRRHPAPLGRGADYSDDLRIGKEIINSTVDSYRKLRNTMRWLLGNLAHYKPAEAVAPEGHARAGAADPQSACTNSTRSSARPTASTTTSASSPTLSNFMNVELERLLLRHPQGRALLRPDLARSAATPA